MMNNENVTIERMVAGGDGLARLADGRVVFVNGAITGEQIAIEITTNKKDFARANIVEILNPSAHRVARNQLATPKARFESVSYLATA